MGTVTTLPNKRLLGGREPAVWLSLVAAVISLVTSFGFDISTDTQGVIQAFAAAVIGLLVALLVRPVAPAAIAAVIQTGLPLLVAFGLDLTIEQQGSILALSALALNLLLVRPQVQPQSEFESPVSRAA